MIVLWQCFLLQCQLTERIVLSHSVDQLDNFILAHGRITLDYVRPDVVVNQNLVLDYVLEPANVLCELLVSHTFAGKI